MSTKTEAKTYSFNGLRWLVILALVAGGIVANSIYGDYPLLYRVVGLLVLALVAFWLAINTAQGSTMWNIVKEAQTEVRKVVWPTRQETTQTSLIVVALVILMALILWLLDTFFGWIASFIIG